MESLVNSDLFTNFIMTRNAAQAVKENILTLTCDIQSVSMLQGTSFKLQNIVFLVKLCPNNRGFYSSLVMSSN